MEKPVENTVFFTVNVHCRERDDHWVAETVETGIITYGDTREAAEALNGEANVALVRRMKREGRAMLARFMREHGLVYALDERWVGSVSSERQPLAA